ncbi:bifunctional methylenetetrahydrofolate dehydrogenase/methenyltetrahydrofolate cyclohydrolase FolD [Ferrimonas balearica]|uniref:bifunctional methylenetetrahydrofolate dehydrogenase/methenyltetrahydrofolate cyclohydrolase FolD n=1 Tax=Ferrimonas balearica TaxID=44012 RepID=UPI001C9946B0|nr:bifunctional methylenetetrahydrofolate dehydrogenase/methenyltetrahydrofolate cyclohydrolase FolD [Ferrimonas balearica]MBY5920240.1 bifunctional methylenetetrahydrofolate dehydrogenase/methenyltetrahydrofolate cyclohydrolase FolD [Ferrimonas balearica]MBY5997075.1 bifunctional methylenetetrahydrofolate dehydrogenase/methenyltetrahydrofolate cyclohydrolase FolD [Ferrimonas balearica]
MTDTSPTQTASLIDGKAIANQVIDEIGAEVRALTEAGKPIPGLAVVLVGEDPASQVYVRNKLLKCQQAGIASREYRLPVETMESDLLGLLVDLNDDPDVHGILVQLPLPKHIDEQKVLQAIAPEKDVDGFHPENLGRLLVGAPDALVPCTPLGCLIMLRQTMGEALAGKHVVVVGRSNIVGKPAALLALQQHCTVTLVHSRTQNIEALCRQADVLIVAVGRPELVKAEWVKPGAVVLDVGINRVERDGKARLVGDVAFDEVAQVASAITPVPGGVGPMTIACLLRNTLQAYQRQQR